MSAARAEAEALPEPDRAEGAPHPRETEALFGHEAAEAEFLSALGAGRLHHAWLIAGPRGVGKATLAWRIARFLLANQPEADAGLLGGLDGAPPTSLSVSPEHPAARRLRALSEPGLFLLRRPWNDKTPRKLSRDITVDEVRRLKGFLALSAADAGRRVVIVDAADELNVAAANAILKLLEEPPEGVVFLIVAHQPARLLPTIRSRCRTLRLTELAAEDLARALAAAGAEVAQAEAEALASLAGGSVGAALSLLNEDGLALYRDIAALLGAVPRHDATAAIALAEGAAGAGRQRRAELTVDLMLEYLARLARRAAGQPLPEAAPAEAEAMARLGAARGAAQAWAGLQQALSERAQHARAVNLDPAALILDIVIRTAQTASRLGV